jgi:hypothetical protein
VVGAEEILVVRAALPAAKTGLTTARESAEMLGEELRRRGRRRRLQLQPTGGGMLRPPMMGMLV